MNDSGRIAVMIADDYPVFRSGLRHLLQCDERLEVVGEAANGEETVAVAQRLRPDVLLLDVQMPRLTGTQVLEELAAIPVPSRVLLMTDDMARQQVIRALNSGARGLIPKNAEEPVFLKAIHRVHKGELWVERDVLTEWARSNARGAQASTTLTAREREIVHEILAGSSNQDIAARFAIAEHTVKRHLTNIYDKLGCSTRLELCLFALHHHVLS
jgi:DNA-binding NarL/FixJ family response regulator